jgi:hypothetical protein
MQRGSPHDNSHPHGTAALLAQSQYKWKGGEETRAAMLKHAASVDSIRKKARPGLLWLESAVQAQTTYTMRRAALNIHCTPQNMQYTRCIAVAGALCARLRRVL